MISNREPIMARLHVLMGTVESAQDVERNQTINDDEESRARRITVMEGDEILAEQEPLKRRPATVPRVYYMDAQVELNTVAGADDIGTDLNTVLDEIVDKIATDAELTALTYDGTGGVYLGMESDLGAARAMAGTYALKFRFAYVRRPGVSA